MCGRFTITADADAIRAEFGLPEVPFDYHPRYNVAPMQNVLAIVGAGDEKRAGWMRWGLVPKFSEDPSLGARMINARSETVDQRAVFREAFERRRCLVVADGFYEWRDHGSAKVPIRIRLSGNRLFAFAGLWDRWTGKDGVPLVTCTILTTTPSPSIAYIHDRMPVILSASDRERWLDRHAEPAVLKSLLHAYPDEELEAYSVANLVSYVENDSAECVEPALPPVVAEQTSLF